MTQRSKTKKVSITVPIELLEEISQEASSDEIDSFFVGAARERLLRLRQKRGLEESFGAWSDENHPELGTPEDTVEYVRSLRNIGTLM